MKKILFIIIATLLAEPLLAQLPNTDIWLMDVKKEGDKITLTNPVNITNRAGYDNQPAFSPDGNSILYSSIRDGKQSDIYIYNVRTKVTTPFESTPATSEYSPTFMPDGRAISVVMVEPDSAQRLWKFPLKGGAPQLIMKHVDSIGYHCWLNDSTVALFLITKPFKLVFTNIKTEHSETIFADTIMRSMKVEGHHFYFGHQSQLNVVDLNIKELNITPMQYAPSLTTEDFALLSDGKFIMADKAVIYVTGRHNEDMQMGYKWLNAADLSSYGIKKITRIAVSPDGKKIAIVAE